MSPGDQAFNLGKEKPEQIPARDLAGFRNEIAVLAAKRARGKVEGMLELLSIDPSDLTETDAFIWNKVKNYNPGLITRADFEKYRQDS